MDEGNSKAEIEAQRVDHETMCVRYNRTTTT